MTNIQHLSETEGAERMIYLNSAPTIYKSAKQIDRNVRELRASAPTVASRTATTSQPKCLAAAIRLLQAEGHVEDLAGEAGRRWPHLVRAWHEDLLANQ